MDAETHFGFSRMVEDVDDLDVERVGSFRDQPFAAVEGTPRAGAVSGDVEPKDRSGLRAGSRPVARSLTLLDRGDCEIDVPGASRREPTIIGNLPPLAA